MIKFNQRIKFFLFLPLLAGSAFLFFKYTKAQFFDTEKILGNTIQVGVWGEGSPEPTPTSSEIIPTPTETLTPTPTPTPTPTVITHLVINEVYPSSDNKLEWVELYNPTGSAIDVSGWKIADKNAYDTGNDDSFPTVAPIPAGGYGVVITNQGTAGDIPVGAIVIQLAGANIGSGLNISGDAVVVKNTDGTIIDAMNFGDVSIFFSSPPAAPPEGSSLIRLPNGQDTDTAADWQADDSPSKGLGN